MRRTVALAPLFGLLVFLYLPISVLVAMSFNANNNPFLWKGFSFRWYGELFSDDAIVAGLRNTLLVATAATALSVLLGTSLAIALERYFHSRVLDALAAAPAVMPDIVMAVGLLSLYSLVSLTLGLHSVALAHTVFGTAFVTALVRTRLQVVDPSLEEASRDLGASGWRTFRRVTLPALRPGILAGGLLAFTLSLDEFTIAFFTASPASPTLPIVLYSMVRFGVTPQVNALAALMLVVSFLAILIAFRLTRSTGLLERR